MPASQDQVPAIALLGECMIELREEQDGRFSRGYGGDVLNTAVYLSRLLGPAGTVRFVSVMGDDPFSDDMIASWESEGIVCDAVGRKRDSVPGLYLVQTDKTGERHFRYWRSAAPARELLTPEWRRCLDAAEQSSWFYVSGITLAILDETGRKELANYLSDAKLRGAAIVFDGNYRPVLWQNADTARTAHEQFWRLSTIALPGAEDEHNLFDDAGAHATVERLTSYGIEEIVVKQGTGPVVVRDGGETAEIAVPEIRGALDTTAAGDSFNAGYLADRMRGIAPQDAVTKGMALAGRVVQHRGAIIDTGHMQDLMETGA